MKTSIKLLIILSATFFVSSFRNENVEIPKSMEEDLKVLGCTCLTWQFDNNTPCDIDIIAETPPPCVVTQGLLKLPANTQNLLRQPGCIQTDCGLICPWAIRVVGASFSMGGPDPHGTIYSNVMPCSGCPSGNVMATYTVISGQPKLVFECQP